MILLERMKPEFRKTIKDDGSGYYDSAIAALTDNKYFHEVTFKGIVAITHFTHPERGSSLLEFIELFN